MADRLSLFNSALTMCGERVLASLTESREPRRLLDQVWDDGGINLCLEAGQWRFAMRAVSLDYDPDITPAFGMIRAFAKPTDWRATSAICSDEYFTVPLLEFSDEAGYWYANINTIYIKYISNDASFGNNLSLWPTRFFDFVACHFASKIVLKLTSGQEKMSGLITLREKLLREAKNHDAMGEPTKFFPPSNWVLSRGNRSTTRRDGGNRGQLIG